jgi:hypothetical protein
MKHKFRETLPAMPHEVTGAHNISFPTNRDIGVTI